jgi:8-oxo-dGTP pyrophosphatase MutT (NUDIX family)
VEAGETIEQTVIRETQEEIGVTPKNIIKVAEFYFCFPHNQDWNQTVHFYQTEDWDGEPTESDEMKPEWFKSDNLPFAKMWPDDFYWMPYFLRGEKIKGFFKFAEGDVILEKEIKVVEGWGG